MYKVILLEDQHEHAEHLLHLLKKYEHAHPDLALSVQYYDRPLQLLSEYRRDVDLLLLDIQMPGMLGIDLARKLRAMDERVMIIFTTSLLQYAVEGYEVQAFDYLVKPISEACFFAKMDRAFRVLQRRHCGIFLTVRTKTDARRIAAEEIAYIEVADHDVLIHLRNEVVRQWGSLKECEEQLKQAHFTRCNACYLVNLDYVREVHGDRVLVDRDELSISRPRRKTFLAELAQYRGGSC